MSIAYSYLRYSSPAQSDGDSIRRQTAAAAGWCKRNGVTLDKNTSYEDRGRSGFHGKHRESGYLRRFLDDVESGTIPRGSILLIENMDRLSRESPVRGVHLLTGILLAGIRVVQLMPDELELSEESDLFSLFRGQMSQARGHDESKTKSNRLTEVWAEKKRKARATGEILTHRLPAWVKARGGKLAPIPKRVAVVRRMFDLCRSGCGLSLIVRQLTAERVQSWGRSGKWSKAYVKKILSGRAVLGEHQPLRDGEPDGDAIRGYYPRVVSEDTWLQAQAALASRIEQRTGRPTGAGRVGKNVASIFGGLLWSAGTDQRVYISWQTQGSGDKRRRRRVLRSAGSMEGREETVSFPCDVFEEAILSMLKEVRPADVLGEEPKGESAVLAAERATLDARIRQIEAELTGTSGDVPALIRAAKALDEKRQDVLKRLAEARRRENNRPAEALGEAKTLMDVATDEAGRLRLRNLLRTVIEAVYVLTVPRPSRRLCAVQIVFAGGGTRDYLIDYRPARRGSAGGWNVLSFADVAGPLDFRKDRDVAKLVRVLERMELPG